MRLCSEYEKLNSTIHSIVQHSDGILLHGVEHLELHRVLIGIQFYIIVSDTIYLSEYLTSSVTYCVQYENSDSHNSHNNSHQYILLSLSFWPEAEEDSKTAGACEQAS